MVLLGMIDDATGRVLTRYYPAETTENYMDLLRRYIEKHGRPVSWYTDRHSIFRAEHEGGECSVPTQFSRALEELGIELILAHSPQAKGRIERLWGTCQDRWVKELRLAEVSTMEGTNELLESKLEPEFNERFTHQPASGNDAHRPLTRAYDLGAILSIQERRVVANDYTVRLANQVYQLLPPVWPGERGGKVIVERRADGTLKIRFKDKYLEYRLAARAAETARAIPARPLPPIRGAGLSGSLMSLAPLSIPAEGKEARPRNGKSSVKAKQSEPAEKAKGPAAGDPSAGPCAVYRTAGRSGRTPALPYPPDGVASVIPKRGHRPAPSHPWRKGGAAKRTFLLAPGGGHF